MEQTQHGSLEELVMAPRRFHETKFALSNDHQYIPSTGQWFNDSLLTYNDSLESSISYSQPMMLTPRVEPQAPSFVPCPSNEIQPYFSCYTPPFQVLDESETTGGHEVNVHDYYNSRNDITSVYDFKETYSCSSSRGVRELSVPSEIPVFSIGSFEDDNRARSKVKKLEGQPSKNLMAERRRRKRLNDRLSMLRSVVPRVSKMDRTSILGDTLDYMKELLEKINKLKMQDTQGKSDQKNSLRNLEELNKIGHEATTKNSSRFDVRRKDKSTEINISCPGKPGMVLSTLNTMETLGLDIQECVVSCFNDFTLEASCSEAEEHRRFISDEDLRRALSRNAGYGGRCL